MFIEKHDTRASREASLRSIVRRLDKNLLGVHSTKHEHVKLKRKKKRSRRGPRDFRRLPLSVFPRLSVESRPRSRPPPPSSHAFLRRRSNRMELSPRFSGGHHRAVSVSHGPGAAIDPRGTREALLHRPRGIRPSLRQGSCNRIHHFVTFLSQFAFFFHGK